MIHSNMLNQIFFEGKCSRATVALERLATVIPFQVCGQIVFAGKSLIAEHAHNGFLLLDMVTFLVSLKRPLVHASHATL